MFKFSRKRLPQVFNQFVYTGTGSAKTITTGLNLSSDGGLVVLKVRNDTNHWYMTDTENGVGTQLYSDSDGSYGGEPDIVTSFTSSGFVLGTDGGINYASDNFMGFSIKKHPKIFDVVTYTGNGDSSRTISHSLGVVPTMIWIKGDRILSNWAVYHQSVDAVPEDYRLELDTGNPLSNDSTVWNDTAPTSSVVTVGPHAEVNASGDDYTMYVFADYDGVFKTGGYTGNGGTLNLDMGFDHGASLFCCKAVDEDRNWMLWTKEMGIGTGNDELLQLDTTDESETTLNDVDYYAKGISLIDINSNNSGDDYIYFAFA